MAGSLRIYGSNSGYVELAAPAVAGNSVLTLPTDSIQSGLVLVAQQSFNSVSSVSFNNCFSSLYDNYLLLFSGNGTEAATVDARLRLRSNGTDYAGSYELAQIYITNTGGPTRGYSNAIGYFVPGIFGNSNINTFTTFIFQPAIATPTGFNSQFAAGGTSAAYFGITSGWCPTTSSYDGVSFSVGAGTITGKIKIYGYRNS